MKLKWIIFPLVFAFIVVRVIGSAHVGQVGWGQPYSPPVYYDPYAAQKAEEELRLLTAKASMSKQQAEAKQAELQRAIWQNFVPEDPYRFFDGDSVYARSSGFVKFGGKILEVTTNGILVEGSYRTLEDPFQFRTYKGQFFVAQFPYALNTNIQTLRPEAESDFTAQEAGEYQTGDSRILPKLDYGFVGVPPAPSVEVADYVAKAAETQIATDSRTLKWNQDQADNGDALGQRRMGERYLSGDGVKKNLDTSREYFLKSAAQGDHESIVKLKDFFGLTYNDIPAAKP